MGKFIDLTGQKSGKLTAIKRIGTNKWKTAIWLCKCECGNTKNVSTTDFKANKVKSCGCLYKINLIGKKFNKLTIIKEIGKAKNGQSIWLCKCDCGNITKVMYGNLVKGTVKSCGCLRKENIKNRIIKHNKSSTRLYTTFYKMKARCYNKNDPAYKNYGGRGIKVCDKWLDKENGFMNFYNWAMDNGYDENKNKKEQSLDRINVNGNYEPNNCRWATAKQQANNTRINHIINYCGKKYTLTQLSDFLGIKLNTLIWRLNHNWKQEELNLPVNFANKYKRRKEE